MTPDERAKLRTQLALHEGLRTTLYRCTSGKMTIGVGYNIDDRGLTDMQIALGRPVTMEELRARGLPQADAMRVLDFDIDKFERTVRAGFPLYDKLDPVRQRVVLDFVFNMGGTRAARFKSAIRFLALALAQSDPVLAEACFTATAFHMMDSVWARQVDDGLAGRKGRADRLCYMMRTGRDAA